MSTRISVSGSQERVFELITMRNCIGTGHRCVIKTLQIFIEVEKIFFVKKKKTAELKFATFRRIIRLREAHETTACSAPNREKLPTFVSHLMTP